MSQKYTFPFPLFLHFFRFRSRGWGYVSYMHVALALLLCLIVRCILCSVYHTQSLDKHRVNTQTAPGQTRVPHYNVHTYCITYSSRPNAHRRKYWPFIDDRCQILLRKLPEFSVATCIFCCVISQTFRIKVSKLMPKLQNSPHQIWRYSFAISF